MTGVQVEIGPRYPLDALVSFHYYKRDEDIGPLVESGRLRMIGDSGAFSALTSGSPIKMGEFAAWCGRWSRHLAWTAALDVIGDPAATLNNWLTMRDRYQLETVPTIHVGTDPSVMDVYVQQGVDFFGLGGMVRRALESFPWIVSVFRYARRHHPHVRFHLWGMTTRKILDAVPAYSADSSGFGAAHRFARFSLFDPASGRMLNVRMMQRQVYAAGPLLRRVYGVDPAWVLTPSRHNRALIMQIYARSYQLLAEWLQRRHRVAAPQHGLRDPFAEPGPGTRIHAVEMPDALASVTRALDPADLDVLRGTRVHVVDARSSHLAAAVADPHPPEAT